jgi:hypothetical protein
MENPVEIDLVEVTVDDPVNRTSYHLLVPGETVEDGYDFLATVGEGTLGAGFRTTYAGQTMEPIRRGYYNFLKEVEERIAERQVALGDALERPETLRELARWSAQQRTRAARIWRLPSGVGGVVGAEIRDWRKYGLSGRTLPNLERYNATKYGIRGSESWTRIAASAAKPNPAETAAILKAARYLKRGGSVLFILGLGLTAYEIGKAEPERRPEIISREAFGFAGGSILSGLAIGVAFLGFGLVGWPLLLVGLVAGIGGGFIGERLFYSWRPDQLFHPLEQNGAISLGQLQVRMP